MFLSRNLHQNKLKNAYFGKSCNSVLVLEAHLCRR